MATSVNTNQQTTEIKDRFAVVLADAARAIVDESMSSASNPERRIDPAEVRHILEGIDRGILSFKGNRIRFASDPLRVCSLFALNREYFLQLSAYISLIVDYGYPIELCGFDYKLLDVCVYQSDLPWIYGETKASQREAELLLDKIVHRYAAEADSHADQPDRGNDPLRKAKQIHKFHSLEYFWLVTPLKRWAFKIERIRKGDGRVVGFALEAIDDIPHYQI